MIIIAELGRSLSTLRDLSKLAWWIVVAGWVTVAAAYLLHRALHRPLARRVRPQLDVGLGLQSAAFAVAFVVDRRPLSPLDGHQPAALLAVAAVATVTAAAVGLIAFALLTLGADWNATADLAAGHRLVTRGPYRWVRHPIYTGMLGLLGVTVAVATRWPAAAAAVLLYLAGTALRVREEERGLASRHGATWDDYRRRVPAVVPRLWRRGD
jgi:protein-S-isoprenylcysteine O-methyltransferase Ste14